MGQFEDFRPKLHAGAWLHAGDSIVFTKKSDLGQRLILPRSFEAVLPLLDGSCSISELVSRLHQKQGQIRFRELFAGLKALQEGHAFVEPIPHLGADKSKMNPAAAKMHRLAQPLFNIPIFVMNDTATLEGQTFRKMIVGLVLAIGVAAGGAGVTLWLMQNLDAAYAGLFRMGSGPWSSLLLVGVVLSALLTARALIQATVILVSGAGTAISFSAYVFALCLRADDRILFHLLPRMHRTLYLLASIGSFSYLAWVLGFMPFFAQVSDQLGVLALILMLIDLNPFNDSTFRRYFRSLWPDISDEDLVPFLRRKAVFAVFDRRPEVSQNSRLIFYGTYSVVWSVVTLMFGMKLVSFALPNFLAAMNADDIFEKMGSLVLYLPLFGLYIYLLIDVGRTLVQNILFPLTQPWFQYVARLLPKTTAKPQAAEFAKLARALPLLEDLKEDVLARVLSLSESLTIRKGTPILIQGMQGDECFILVSGVVRIQRRRESGFTQNVANLQAPTVFGEVAVLDNRARTADVIAEEDCHVLKIHRNVLNSIQSEFPNALSGMRDKIALQQAMAASTLFAGLPQEVLGQFRQAGHLKPIQGGATLFREGEAGKSFFFVVRGRLSAQRGSTHVGLFKEGDFFGEISVMTGAPRTATITAVENSQIFELPDGPFWNILSKNLNLATFIEHVAERRAGAQI